MKSQNYGKETYNVTLFTYFLRLKHVPTLKHKLTNHFSSANWLLRRKFSLCFKDVDVSKSEGVRNLFATNNVSGVTTSEQEQLRDVSCEGSLEDMFDADKLPQFWLLVKNDCRSLTEKARNVLLPFVTTYLCEAGFRVVPVTKTKRRSQLIIKKIYELPFHQ
jgi:hypothetical protein